MMDASKQQAFQPTEEERAVLTACIRESVATRVFPAIIVGGGLAWLWDVRLKGRPVSYMRIACASLVCGLTTKGILLRECINRTIRECPDGTFATAMREQEQLRRGVVKKLEIEEPVSSYPAEPQAPSFLDIDTQPPVISGLDDTVLTEEPPPPTRSRKTYDELRQQNRGGMKYEGLQGRRGIPTPDAVPSQIDPFSSEYPAETTVVPERSAPKKRGKVNQYGDVWDE